MNTIKFRYPDSGKEVLVIVSQSNTSVNRGTGLTPKAAYRGAKKMGLYHKRFGKV